MSNFNLKNTRSFQKHPSWLVFLVIFPVLYFLAITHSFAAAKTNLPLTLQEAEVLSLQMRLKTQTADGNDKITGQVPDTSENSSNSKMTFGVENVLVNTAPINQGDNTIFKIGFQQKIPSADIYGFQTEQAQALSSLAFKKQRGQVRSLHRTVRNLWLDLYYWTQALEDLQATQLLFTHLIDNASSAAKPEISIHILPNLTQLANQQDFVQGQIVGVRKQLGSLVGQDNTSRPLPPSLPNWPTPPTLARLQKNLSQHPKLQEDTATIQAIRAGASLVKEKNKSSFGIGASYGVRQNEFMGGDPKPDTFSAELKFHLSSNAEQQQNKVTRANVAALEAAQLKQEEDYRQLSADLIRNYGDWQKYQQEIVTLNTQQANIDQQSAYALEAYQTNHRKINLLINAYRAQLQLQLNKLRAEVNQAQARVNLMYFE